GLSDAHLVRLFSELPRPMTFDPAAVTYSFSFGWVAAKTEPPMEPDEIVEDHLDTWLEELAEAGGRARLNELRERIGELLESMPEQVAQGHE
ncbi:MAG: hypothetical protein Q8M65_09905, partial [Rhodoglobus sp.]|nr:hypothetical protein [Rhodoglobus sp.]